MPTLLYISVSPRRAASRSRLLGGEMVQTLRAGRGPWRVIERDLDAAPPPHPDAAFTEASLMLPEKRGLAQQAALVYSEELIGELEAADLVVISTPMNNFTVPSALKAWIDYIVRPRRTFGFSPAGKVGLLRDRPVWVVAACGGSFTSGVADQTDFLTPYLRYVLGSVGITSVDVHLMERLGRDPAQVDLALQGAREWIRAKAVALAG